jgi:hypothetical protein
MNPRKAKIGKSGYVGSIVKDYARKGRWRKVQVFSDQAHFIKSRIDNLPLFELCWADNDRTLKVVTD